MSNVFIFTNGGKKSQRQLVENITSWYINTKLPRYKNLNIEIDFLEKKFLDHEIRKKRSLDKSALINKSSLLENEKKADDELQNLRKA